MLRRCFDWHTGWADKYRQYARLGSDGLVYFDGLIIDGWVPKGAPAPRGMSDFKSEADINRTSTDVRK